MARAGQGRHCWRTPAGPVPQDPGGGTTLDAYRRRAASLADELEATPAPALGERLGRMAAELVDELALAGAESLPDQVPRGKPASRASGSAAFRAPPELRDRVVVILREFAVRRP